MSEQTDDQGGSGQPRDGKGRFTPKKETESSGQSSPKSSEYTKMNSLLAKQLGLSDKLADFQTKYDPQALFNQLSFMVDNVPQAPVSTSSGGLPPNEQVAPISPPIPRYELPGEQMSKPNLTEENFSVSFRMSPKDLINPQKNKKQE